VTSTVDRSFGAESRRRTGAGLLGILSLILLGQLVTPEPWTYLWPVLPVVGAAGLLLAQTNVPVLGWAPTVACLVSIFALGMTDQPWAWCLTAGALASSLLGVAERAGTESERRAWAYLPIVALAATFPLAPGYRDLIARIAQAISGEEARQLASFRQMALEPDQRLAVEQMIALSTEVELKIAQNVLPTVIFAWLALLVQLAERMARRLAELVRRPLLPSPPFALWRLPDGAVWLFVLGLGLVAARDDSARPVGVNLAAAVGIGFALQGLAVVKWFLAGQGMSPALVVLMFAFTSLLLGPVVPLAAAGVGLMDQWLDFRKLESSEGGRSWK
jgi:hypothetical protein